MNLLDVLFYQRLIRYFKNAEDAWVFFGVLAKHLQTFFIILTIIFLIFNINYIILNYLIN